MGASAWGEQKLGRSGEGVSEEGEAPPPHFSPIFCSPQALARIFVRLFDIRLERERKRLLRGLLFSNEAHRNSGVRLLLELYCVIVITEHVPFFTICAKLAMTFTFTSLPLNSYTSVSECV